MKSDYCPGPSSFSALNFEGKFVSQNLQKILVRVLWSLPTPEKSDLADDSGQDAFPLAALVSSSRTRG